MRRAFFLSLPALALAACASGPAAPAPSPPPGPGATASIAKVGTTETTKAETPNADALTFARALVDLDQRVDRYVFLMSQAGLDAHAERELLGPALRAQVGQYKDRLLAAVVDKSDPGRRRIAAKALAFCDSPAAVPALVACLSEKGDEALLVDATYSLSQLRSPATPPEPLLALLMDLDPMVRGNALLALWHVFDAKRAIGASPLDPVSQSAAMTLLETALFDTADAVIRANAAAAVGALGDPRAVDALMNLLRDDHPLVRTQTAIALGKLGDAKAIPALVVMIDATPAGTPRTAVLLSLQTLIEKRGVTVPDNLGDSQRVWEVFVRDKLGSGKR